MGQFSQRKARQISMLLCGMLLAASTPEFAADAMPLAVPTAKPTDRNDFQKVLHEFRDVGVMAPVLLVDGWDVAAQPELQKALGRDDEPGALASWRLFFAGAGWLAGKATADTATAALFNPVYDALLVTSWHRTKRGWALSSLEPITGNKVLGEPEAAMPGWTHSGGNLVAGLQNMPVPSADQIAASAAQPIDAAERSRVLARIVALQGSALPSKHGKTLDAELSAVALAIRSADHGGPQAAGATPETAATISRLGRAMRRDLVVLAIVPEKNGTLAMLAPERAPGLLYLARIGGATPALTLVDLMPVHSKGTQP